MTYDFQEGVHRESNKFFHRVEGCYKVRDVMHWYIEKVCYAAYYILILGTIILISNVFGQGKEVETDRPIRKKLYRSRSMEADLPSFLDFKIFQCESEHPPKYKNHHVTLHSTIVFQLGQFGSSAWEVYNASNGRRFKKITYTLEMVPSGASTQISVWVKGQRLGSKYISIQFD